MHENPWVSAARTPPPSPVSSVPAKAHALVEIEEALPPSPVADPDFEGAFVPQPATVPPPDTALPFRVVESTDQVWWFGVHGGAGESTLAAISGGQAADHRWPQSAPEDTPATVVLVARTHHAGLLRAQHAATEWASGQVRARLVGMVLVADAPGKLPKPLRDLSQVVAGGVPRVWRLPWISAWRSAAPTPDQLSFPVRRILQSVAKAAASSQS